MVGIDQMRVVLPPDDEPVVRLAIATVGKWRMAGTATKLFRLGFDLQQIEVARDWMGIRKDARLLTGLTIIEREALRILERDT